MWIVSQFWLDIPWWIYHYSGTPKSRESVPFTSHVPTLHYVQLLIYVRLRARVGFPHSWNNMRWTRPPVLRTQRTSCNCGFVSAKVQERIAEVRKAYVCWNLALLVDVVCVIRLFMKGDLISHRTWPKGNSCFSGKNTLIITWNGQKFPHEWCGTWKPKIMKGIQIGKVSSLCRLLANGTNSWYTLYRQKVMPVQLYSSGQKYSGTGMTFFLYRLDQLSIIHYSTSLGSLSAIC